MRMSLLHEGVGQDRFAELSRFRGAFDSCPTQRADALSELSDAVLCADEPVRSLVEPSLASTAATMAPRTCSDGQRAGRISDLCTSVDHVDAGTVVGMTVPAPLTREGTPIVIESDAIALLRIQEGGGMAAAFVRLPTRADMRSRAGRTA